MMTLTQNNLTQSIPQSINSNERSIFNISTITYQSNGVIIVSPVAAKNNIPNTIFNRLVTVPTSETKVGLKIQ